MGGIVVGRLVLGVCPWLGLAPPHRLVLRIHGAGAETLLSELLSMLLDICVGCAGATKQHSLLEANML